MFASIALILVNLDDLRICDEIVPVDIDNDTKILLVDALQKGFLTQNLVPFRSVCNFN